ncbi:ninjurin-B-like [Ochlerotatus camptorhynchus]|uniref:ninjurin-B-like n=1 Tax=Ochlerotatus camptorhynchus TaxID=644619 RepID=UPI0031DAEF9A
MDTVDSCEPPKYSDRQGGKRVEQSGNGAVHIFTGNEKQRKVLTNPVIWDRNADRVRPHLDNEWANFERTPNRQAEENFNRMRRTLDRNNNNDNDSDNESRFDMYRNVVENALNVAFLAANSNQLRLLTEFQEQSDVYQVCVGMLIMSLILQILVGVSMVTISINADQRWKKLKVIASIGVAVIAIVNIVVLSLVNAILFK